MALNNDQKNRMRVAMGSKSAGDLVSNYLLGWVQCKKILISSTPTGSEQDTGWDLPSKAIVLDVWLDVTTVEATGTTKTLDVGLLASESGGDADGFLKGVSVASTTGIKRGVPTLTTGSNEVYFASTTRGALFAALTAGTDNAGDVGTYFEKPHLAGSVTAKSISYTSASANFAEFRGAIYILYIDVDAFAQTS